jgi:hypothetical protein
VKRHRPPRWALTYYHVTYDGRTETIVIGPFATQRIATDYQYHHGPRLAMLVEWKYVPPSRDASGRSTTMYVTPDSHRSPM